MATLYEWFPFLETFIKQFPTVFAALNTGFLQTLKLFSITLIGAIPLGLIISFGSMSRFKPLSGFIKAVIWVVRGTPLMLQLLILFSRSCVGKSHMGKRRVGALSCILRGVCFQLRVLFRRNIPRRHTERARRSDRGGACTRNVGSADIFQGNASADDKADSSAHVKRDNNACKGYVPCAHNRPAGDNLGGSGVHKGLARYPRRYMAAVFHRYILSFVQRSAHGAVFKAGKAPVVFQSMRRCAYVCS